MSYVYILKHSSDDRFKIGKAVDIPTRVSQLGHSQFDISSSQALRLSSENDANNVERLLHRAFAKWRIDPAVLILEEGGRRDGDTEWFDSSCYERLNSFLADNHDLLQYSLISSNELETILAEVNNTQTNRTVKTETQIARDVERERIRADKLVQKNLREQNEIATFKAIVETIPPLLNALNKECENLSVKDGQYGKCLRGSYRLDANDKIEDLIMSLHDKRLIGANGGYNIFPSYTSQQDDDLGIVHFELQMNWVTALNLPDIYEQAMNHLKMLASDLEWWPTPSSTSLGPY